MCKGSEVEINMRCFQEMGRSPHVSGVQGSGRAGSAELRRQVEAKPAQASVSEGCKLSPMSNGKPRQVSKQPWNKTKFALCKEDSRCSVESGLNDYEETSQEAIALSEVRGDGGQSQVVTVKRKERSRRHNPQSILHTAER